MRNFTKTNAQMMRIEVAEALQAIEKKYNSKLAIGNIRYGQSLTIALTFSKMDENEHGTFINTPKATEFMRRASSMGLSEDMLNEPMMYNGELRVITGYNTRARRYPIEYTSNGKGYKCSVDHMKKFVKETRPEFFL